MLSSFRVQFNTRSGRQRGDAHLESEHRQTRLIVTYSRVCRERRLNTRQGIKMQVLGTVCTEHRVLSLGQLWVVVVGRQCHRISCWGAVPDQPSSLTMPAHKRLVKFKLENSWRVKSSLQVGYVAGLPALLPIDLRVMAGQDSVVPDLTSDNFDLLRFPSLTGFAHELPADNDDLNIMARLGSLFDPSVKATLPSISPLSPTGDAAQPAQQPVQQMPEQINPAGVQPVHTPPRAQQPMPFSANSPGYPLLSPRSSAPNAAQMIPRPPMMVRFVL